MANPSPEDFARVRYIYDSLTPKPEELLQRGRYYVREGPVLIWDENRRKKSKRYVFLLSDVLLITKRDGRTKYWLRIFITLRSPHVYVEDLSSGFEHVFRLTCRTRSFTFFLENDAASWVTDLNRSIKGPNADEDRQPISSGSSTFSSSSANTRKSSNKSSPSESSSSVRSTAPRDFSSFTDSDFVETKVTFDSGVKLKPIRADRGVGDDAPIPVLAPPPRRNGSVSSSSNFNATVQSTQQSQNNDIFGFGAPTTSVQQPNPQTNQSNQTALDFFSSPATVQTQPNTNNQFAVNTQQPPMNYGTSSLSFQAYTIPTQPLQPTVAPTITPTITPTATQAAQPVNPFMMPTTYSVPTQQVQPSMQPMQPMQPAMQPSMSQPFQPTNNMFSAYNTAPQPQQKPDAFADLWAIAKSQPVNTNPAQSQQKSVDFF